ncbi:orotidine-5'-phosphate decarboxylase [Azospirillum rugosum]|uniref:Orotidine 5'-phosphate decarboxylase n=1 Tax=Azospirillum rugosum TaxID=416170 RepID=A0ABS4SU13_9PROT|nr:orotidine-5'-phosphate decarboxylase [Azospirillum rugosum]MBP2295598.1 orotidine-5'-phosphate decarboxylase [Azospirillum rugosum]MDQ0529512.1 orotidine-5'-phosphate decarboxylase [Azospirillum rugosum]
MTTPASRIFCAVDTTDLDTARDLGRRISGVVGGIKLGLEFFVAHGPAGIRAVIGEANGDSKGPPLFLDLKLHDIPNTVAGGIRAALPLKPAFMTIHSAGGPAMMRAAAEAAASAGAERPKILAVTVLTSLDAGDLESVGQRTPVAEQVTRLARLAKDSGVDGVVCSPAEVALVRAACGPDFILMVPGIRPAWAAANDQKRIMTPAEALAAGADHLVIGRPITGDADPAAAARRIVAEIEEGAGA